MKLYIKYFKKYWMMILVMVALVAGQVTVMLALPKYMASMINTGIQQKGIEMFVYPKLDKETYQNFELLATNSEKQILSHSYELNDNHYVLKNSSEQLEKTTLKFNHIFFKLFSNQEKLKAFMKENEISDLRQIGMLNDSQKDDLFKEYAIVELDASEKIVQSNLIYSMNQKLGVEDTSIKYIISKGMEMLLVAFSGLIFVICAAYVSSLLSSRVSRDLRKMIFEKIESFSEREFEQFSTASLITRTINDTNQIQQMLGMVIRIGFMSPLVAIGAFIQSGSTNLDLVWIIGLGVFSFIVIMSYVLVVLGPKFEKFQKILDRINLVLRENLSGLRVIRAFNTEKVQTEKFDDVNTTLLNNNLSISKVIALVNPGLMFITNMTSVLIVYFGSPLVASGNMQIGGLLSFIQFATQVMFSFMMVGFLFFMIPRINISLKRIDEIMISVNILKDPLISKESVEEGTVEFRNVSFSYDHDSLPALSNLSFKAYPGKITAFIGGTGSGKSTIGKLIQRFYDVSEGEVIVDGVNVKDYTQENLRKKIGYVPQKGQVFSKSIKENIAYGNESIDESRMIKAAKIACAEEFISEKEGTYDHVLEQRGANLSGGQKQRVQIARAIYKGSKILFFDDSFSALDYKTDVKLRSNLHQEMKDATILIVAQRIPTIMHADEIIVLNDGEVVGRGTHDELIQTCEVYQDIAESQIEEDK